jgi:nucleotide-binding universal stress UspA family protein
VTESDIIARSVFIWVSEGTWRAAIDAALSLAPADAAFTLLHVTDDAGPDAAHGAYRGMFGRVGHDPGARLDALATAQAADLLEAAGRRLGRPCDRLSMHGNTERAVVTASASADLLIIARDGDRSRGGPPPPGRGRPGILGHPQRPGPHCLGRAGRFIVDHAICPVLVVWPGPPPRDTPGEPRTPGKPDRKRHAL